MKVVEDFESRPHKAEKEIQEWNEQKLPSQEEALKKQVERGGGKGEE